jgi:hypothetical protein
MECDKIQEQLFAYLDDALSSAEKGVIDIHLKSCPKCSKSLADLELTVRSIKGLEEIIPPPWLTQKIMTRVKTEAEFTKKDLWQKLFYPLHVKLPLEAFGAFLIALTALYVFKSMEPKINTATAPSERTVSEYAAKEKDAAPGTEAGKPSQAPIATRAKKDETTAAGSPPIRESSPVPAAPAEQPIFDQGQPVKEKHTETRKSTEREMLMKSAPAPAGLSAPNAVSRESAPQGAGKIMSGLSEKEDISLSFKAGDIGSAKRDIEEVLSALGGKVIREEPTSDALIITGELGSDKLLLFMDKLKALGSVKEKIMRPIAGKNLVLIKITVSNQ